MRISALCGFIEAQIKRNRAARQRHNNNGRRQSSYPLRLLDLAAR
jgi:hypothetical protein